MSDSTRHKLNRHRYDPISDWKHSGSSQNAIHEGFNPPPQGTRTVFPDTEEPRKDSSATRSHSREPESRFQREKSVLSERERDRRNERSKTDTSRPRSTFDAARRQITEQSNRQSGREMEKERDRRKRERSESFGLIDEYESGDERPKDYEESSSKRRRLEAHEEHDELDSLSHNETDHRRNASSSRTTVYNSTPPTKKLFDIGIGRIKSLVPSLWSGTPQPSDHNKPAGEAGDESATLLAASDAELKYIQSQLRASQKQCEDKESELRFLQEEVGRQRDLRRACEEDLDSCKSLLRDAQQRTDELENEKERWRHDNRAASDRQLALDRAEARIAELEKEKRQWTRHREQATERIEVLTVERGQLKGQLKQLRRNADKISLDVFDNTVDQVSEASIKSAVESLNDSINNLVLSLVDVAEQEQKGERCQELGVPLDMQKNVLMAALGAFCTDPEKRGFLLEAACHARIFSLLNILFFARESAPMAQQWEDELLEQVLQSLTASKPWAVSQRWRALTAESIAPLVEKRQDEAISHVAEAIIDMFTWTYQQTRAVLFTEPFQAVLMQLAAIFKEASKLAVAIRRDVLSVRMSVVFPEDANGNIPLYDPDWMEDVWPDMGARRGDEVLAVYDFGLQRRTEHGEVSILLKPKVTTAALLREMHKGVIISVD